MLTRIFCLLTLIATTAFAEEPKFQPMFNGKNFEGWVPVNTAPSTWSIKDGMIVCSGKPIGEMRTTKMFQNFIMELEWRHMKPKGNAGVFVWADDITARGVPFHRGIEVQVLENAYGNTKGYTTHGDIFPIHGATMTPINGRGGSRAFPTENRSKPSPEWNHYRIECNEGNISLAVNGKVVTQGKNCSPRKGYICLESEGGIVHYRNLKIQELPNTPIEDKHIAIADRGYHSLYNGIDLSGWDVSGSGWKTQDWVLNHTGDRNSTLSLQNTTFQGRAEFLFDVKLDKNTKHASVRVRDVEIPIDPKHKDIGKHLEKTGRWNRLEGKLAGNRLTLKVNGQTVWKDREATGSKTGTLKLSATGAVSFANIYIRK